MKKLLPYIGLASGSFIFAFGLNYFIIANGLAEGGFTGLALIIHYLTGLPTGSVLLVLNIPLLIMGWIKWGKSFFLKTVLSVIAVSLAIDLTSTWGLKAHDLLLAALYGGVLSGVGIGIVLRSGGSTGGVDIISRYIHEAYGLSMGKFFFLFDLIILTIVGLLFGLEIALYTLVTVYIFSLTIDRIIEGVDEAKAVIVISQATMAISQSIIREMDRGATLVKGYGAYTGRDKDVLFVVVGKYQLLRLKKIIRDHDPRAFIIINNVYEVLGEGFRSTNTH